MNFQTLGMEMIEFMRKLKDEADLALIGDTQDKRKIVYKDMMKHIMEDEPQEFMKCAQQEMKKRREEFLQRIEEPKYLPVKKHLETLSSEEERNKY